MLICIKRSSRGGDEIPAAEATAAPAAAAAAATTRAAPLEQAPATVPAAAGEPAEYQQQLRQRQQQWLQQPCGAALNIIREAAAAGAAAASAAAAPAARNSSTRATTVAATAAAAQAATLVLVLGDENLTFSGCLLQQLRNEGLNPKITDEVVSRGAALTNEGLQIMFGLSFSQMKMDFFGAKFDQVISVLPGLAFLGCPDFIPFASPLFQLRLHHFLFSVAKAAKAVCLNSGRFRVLWASQALAEALGFALPFPSIDFAALATFCQVSRVPQQDTQLDLSQYGNWQPMIHPHEPIDKDMLSLLLQTLQFHTLSLERTQSPQREPVNFLRIPQSLFQFDLNILSHVNDLFHFDLKNKAGAVVPCVRLTLKYDPRITGWRGEGAPQAFTKAGKNRGGEAAAAAAGGFEEGNRKRPFGSFHQPEKRHEVPQPTEIKARPAPKMSLRVRRRYCTTSTFAYGDF
ncbi:hypothetical protein Emag_002838 [Eimeria magna]